MRTKGRAVLAAAVMLAVAGTFALAACGTKAATNSGTATNTGTPVKGGKLVVAFQGDPTGLDPAIAWEVESNCIERVTYQTLLTYADASGAAGAQLVPDLATEVPTAANGGITKGGRVYTFHIKKGMEFAPPVSRDVTAQDFKYSIERMLKSPLAPATYFYTGITGAQAFMDGKAKDVQGIKVVDPSTLQITLDKPDVSFLYTMTLTFTSAVPKEWVAQVGKEINRKPLGTGPYMITKWSPGQEIVCKPNPNWHLDKQQWLNEIDFTFSSNPSTALLEVERGEVDLMGDPVSPVDYQRTKIDPTWGKYLAEAPQIDSFYAFLNVQVKPFNNPLVRQAVNYAVDKMKLQKLLSGQAVASNQVYPLGMPGYEAGKQFYSYDPAKAKQLLTQAGYPNGFSTTLYTHNVDPFPKVAQALQADLKAVGINAAIKQMDRATYWDKIELQNSRMAMGLTDWYMDYPDPSDWIGPLYSSASAVDGGSNVGWWKNPQVDSLYKASASVLDPAKRIAMYKQMQDIIMSQAPTVPLYQSVYTCMRGKNTGGFFIQPVWIYVFQDYWKTNGQ
jgi:oligopeptide transport system substrate-binding protein